MSSGAPPGSTSLDDVRQAIEALSNADNYRLAKAGRACLAGTEYADADELLNETFLRTLRRAAGEKGRFWPRDVPFVAFLIQTMQGLANDSHHSSYVTQTQAIETMAMERVDAEDALGRLGHAHSDVVSLAIEAGERAMERDRASEDTAKIDAFFSGDSEVEWLIMGHKEGLPAGEIRELAGLSQTQYETARRRFRRGVERLFPGRSTK